MYGEDGRLFIVPSASYNIEYDSRSIEFWFAARCQVGKEVLTFEESHLIKKMKVKSVGIKYQDHYDIFEVIVNGIEVPIKDRDKAYQIYKILKTWYLS